MKCEIIRDLLPSYIEGLTSEESRQAIESHLKTCPDCQQYLEEMQAGIAAPEIDAANKKEIKPFKKLHKRTWKAIGLTVLICVLLFGGGAYYYGHQWAPASEDVIVKCEKVGDVVTLSFYAKDETLIMNSYVDNSLEDGSDQVNLQLQRQNPFRKPFQKSGYFGYTFVDDNTVYTPSGSKRKLTDDDVLTIKYRDKDVKIKIKDLADGKL